MSIHLGNNLEEEEDVSLGGGQENDSQILDGLEGGRGRNDAMII